MTCREVKDKDVSNLYVYSTARLKGKCLEVRLVITKASLNKYRPRVATRWKTLKKV